MAKKCLIQMYRILARKEERVCRKRRDGGQWSGTRVGGLDCHARHFKSEENRGEERYYSR
jgi:hypothetical protein